MRPNVEALTEKAMDADEPTYFSCAVLALATYIQALEESLLEVAAEIRQATSCSEFPCCPCESKAGCMKRP